MSNSRKFVAIMLAVILSVILLTDKMTISTYLLCLMLILKITENE